MPAPPITIGELTDVPAFDSPIASPWAQEVSRRVAHRFATTAERDAKYPANSAGVGALCVAANVLYVSDGVRWNGRQRITGIVIPASDSGFPSGIGPGIVADVPMCQVTIPTAGMFRLDLTVGLLGNASWSAALKVKRTPTAGSPITVVFQMWVTSASYETVDVHPFLTAAAGDNFGVTATYGNVGTGTFNWFADPTNFQISAELGQAPA